MTRQTAITRSARGEQCLVRTSACNYNPETVVLAHRNGAGMGMRAPDWQGCYACSACHEWLDGGYVRAGVTRETRDRYHYEAILRTQERLVEKGLIQIKGRAA